MLRRMNAKVKRWLPLGIIWVAAVISGVIFLTSRDDNASATASPAQQPTGSQQRQGGFDPNNAPGGRPFGFGGGGSATFEQFTDCLSDHGVELSPGSGRPDLSDADVQAAFEACRQYLPGGDLRFGPRGDDHEGTPPTVPDTPSQDGGGNGSDV
jgi:hypothetical protein